MIYSNRFLFSLDPASVGIQSANHCTIKNKEMASGIPLVSISLSLSLNRFLFHLVDDPADRYDRTVGCVVRNLDPVSFVACMDDLVVAHVDRHMAVITDQISRFCLG